MDRKEFFCDGCPYQHDTAGQLWDLDDLAGCIALLLAVSSGMTIGMNIRATTEAIANRLLEFVAMITGDRVFDNDSYELIE